MTEPSIQTHSKILIFFLLKLKSKLLSSKNEQNQKTYIEGINPLRFFAAMGIILYNSSIGRTDKFPSFLKLLIHNLPVCVDFFFIISGFLIVYLLLNEKKNADKISVRNFYIRRVLRILPLYYLVVGIGYFLDSNIEVGKYLFFLGNFSMVEANAWPTPVLTPLWSICIEEQFYLFIPLVIGFLPNRNIFKFLIGIILVSILFRFWSYHAYSRTFDPPIPGWFDPPVDNIRLLIRI